jgi:hypothetical protein
MAIEKHNKIEVANGRAGTVRSALRMGGPSGDNSTE